MKNAIQLWANGPFSPPMGIGTWAWGDTLFWDYQKDGCGDSDLKAAFDACLDADLIFFDTAEVYGSGRSEKLLGSFERDSGKELVIGTKFFPYPWRFSKASIKKAFNDSLERLGRESVEIYQPHWPKSTRSPEFWLEAIAELHQLGKVKNIGLSNFGLGQTQRAYALLKQFDLPIACNQVEFNLLNRKAETSGLINLCGELDIQLMAYSPIAQGNLTGKFSKTSPPPGIRGLRTRAKQLDALADLIVLLKEIGTHYGGKTPAQVALNWTIQKGTVPIVGVKNLRQAQENFGALGWSLREEDVVRLDFASQKMNEGHLHQ